MRAVTLSSSSEVRLVELPSRPLRRGEFRVAVRAIGVNPVDWKIREDGFIGLVYPLVAPRPLVPGNDFAGEVIEVSPGVPLRVGERVVGSTDPVRGQYGSYASEVIVQQDQVASLPDAVSFEVASALPIPGATALRALRIRHRVGAGDRVLVLGASGGVGLMSVQLARRAGAEVFGVCSSKNRALVEDAGARVIDYTEGDPLEAARALGPFPKIVQLVPSTIYPLARVRSLLAPGGSLVVVAPEPRDVPFILLRREVSTLLGTARRGHLEELIEGVVAGDVRPHLEASFPLERAAEAIARSREGHVPGKLWLVP